MNEKLKRLLLGVGAFAALAVGGAQFAGAQGDHAAKPAAAKPAAAETAAQETVTGVAADKATAAALADGSATDVHLDKQFKVLGTDVADQDDDGSDHAEE